MNATQVDKYIKAYDIYTGKLPGYCHGFARMAMIACLSGPGEYQRYQTRLDYMNEDDFLKQMEAFIKMRAFVQEVQLSITVDIFHTDKSKSPLLKWSLVRYAAKYLHKKEDAIKREDVFFVYQEETHTFVEKCPLVKQYAASALNKKEDEINVEDFYSIYLDTRAFLETMAIHSNPFFYSNLLFNKEEAIVQYDSETVLPLTSSFLAEKKGGVCETNSFTRLYSDEEMITHLKAISSIQTEKPFALMLYCARHTITLFYEKNKKQWIVDDHGFMTVYDDSEDGRDELSNKLKTSLSKVEKNYYAVSTKVYCLKSDSEEVTRLFLAFVEKETSIKADASPEEIASLFRLAAQLGHIETVKAALEHGCDVNAKGEEKFPALYIAAHNNQKDIVKFLLEQPLCDLNATNQSGLTALHTATKHGYIDIVELLLKHPLCNPHARSQEGLTALQVSQQNGPRKLVELLRQYTFCHMNKKNENGEATIYPAKLSKHEEGFNSYPGTLTTTTPVNFKTSNNHHLFFPNVSNNINKTCETKQEALQQAAEQLTLR